jgi:DNA polymerase III delta subunit
MNNITTIIGTKENITEDVRIFSEKLTNNPEILIITKKDIKDKVIEKASALFFENNTVLVLLDPERELLEEIKGQLVLLKEKMHIIIYFTTAAPYTQSPIECTTIIIKKDREKRIKDRVLALLKKYNKVMTDKGFKLFRERVIDESVLETELMKLINYVGVKKEIKSGDVRSIVTETHEENLLNFFDVIAQTDKKEMLNTLETLLLSGMNLLAIQGFLVKQARLMLQAKDMEEILKANHDYPAFSKIFNKWKESIEMTPLDKKLYLPYQKTFYAYKLSKTGQRFKKKDLLSFLNMLMDLDTKIKSGTKQDRIHMEHGLIEA